MASTRVVVEVATGPALRMCLDVLDVASELFENLPDYVEGRNELESRTMALVEGCQLMLNNQWPTASP